VEMGKQNNRSMEYDSGKSIKENEWRIDG